LKFRSLFQLLREQLVNVRLLTCISVPIFRPLFEHIGYETPVSFLSEVAFCISLKLGKVSAPKNFYLGCRLIKDAEYLFFGFRLVFHWLKIIGLGAG
jgi:hypothetical protein